MNGDGASDQRGHWDNVFRGAEDYFGPGPSEFGQKAQVIIHNAGARDILELICGQGRDTWLFAREGFGVIALDCSESGICQMRGRAEKLCLESTVECVVKDVRAGIRLPDDSVDTVYSHMFFTMELWEKEISFILDECSRVLIPGGLNIFSVRNDRDPHFQKWVHKGGGHVAEPDRFRGALLIRGEGAEVDPGL